MDDDEVQQLTEKLKTTALTLNMARSTMLTKPLASDPLNGQTSDVDQRRSDVKKLSSAIERARCRRYLTDGVPGVERNSKDTERQPNVETVLERHANGFGIQFGGAKTVNDGETRGYGIFISGIKAGSAAAHNPVISSHLGWQIVTLGERSLFDATFAELKAALHVVSNNVHIELRWNVELLNSYDVDTRIQQNSSRLFTKFRGPDITAVEIYEVGKYNQPTPAIKQLAEIVCILCDAAPSWSEGISLLRRNDGFVRLTKDFNPYSTMTGVKRRALKKFVSCNAFAELQNGQHSSAAAKITLWIWSVHKLVESL